MSQSWRKALRKMQSTDPTLLHYLRKTMNQLSPGTLYPVLLKLEKAGKIRQFPNRKTNTYVLTEEGKSVLDEFQNQLGRMRILWTYFSKWIIGQR